MAPAESPCGTETILLVEDEATVRQLVMSMLQPLGYTVLQASNGIEAQVFDAEYSVAIDLLITDVVMPQISGRQVAEHLKSSRPDMKVLFISGYTDNAIVHHGVLDAGVAFLQKPFTPDVLARKVREVLDGPRQR